MPPQTAWKLDSVAVDAGRRTPATPRALHPASPRAAAASPRLAGAGGGTSKGAACGRPACMAMNELAHVHGSHPSLLLRLQLPGGRLPATWSPPCLEQVGKGALATASRLAATALTRLHHVCMRPSVKLLGVLSWTPVPTMLLCCVMVTRCIRIHAAAPPSGCMLAHGRAHVHAHVCSCSPCPPMQLQPHHASFAGAHAAHMPCQANACTCVPCHDAHAMPPMRPLPLQASSACLMRWPPWDGWRAHSP